MKWVKGVPTNSRSPSQKASFRRALCHQCVWHQLDNIVGGRRCGVLPVVIFRDTIVMKWARVVVAISAPPTSMWPA